MSAPRAGLRPARPPRGASRLGTARRRLDRRAQPTTRAAQRGVSLIEAIVAMAVMAFGMIGIVGLQSTLRQNADVAKQRSEAVRIAEEAIEQWRAFSIMGATAGASAGFDSIQTPVDQVIAADATNKFNTTFTLQRTVGNLAGLKSLRAQVSWVDRTGQAQSIVLDSIIAASDPALSGRLTMESSAGGAALPPQGRHAAIPVVAKDLGNGKSGFKPPAPGGDVVWVFDNLSGVIVGVCNTITTGQASLTAADVSSCSNNANGLPLSGFVRFATGPTQPTTADAENPTSLARNLAVVLTLSSTGHPSPDHVCYSDAPAQPSSQTDVAYHCAILFNAGAPLVWSGISTLTPLAFPLIVGDVPWHIAANAADANALRHRVCRYTPAASDADPIPNHQHPRQYANVKATEPLTNQNFLVIRAGNDSGGGGTPFICPTDGAADPAHGDFVNSNTLAHQPPP